MFLLIKHKHFSQMSLLTSLCPKERLIKSLNFNSDSAASWKHQPFWSEECVHGVTSWYLSIYDWVNLCWLCGGWPPQPTPQPQDRWNSWTAEADPQICFREQIKAAIWVKHLTGSPASRSSVLLFTLPWVCFAWAALRAVLISVHFKMDSVCQTLTPLSFWVSEDCWLRPRLGEVKRWFVLRLERSPLQEVLWLSSTKRRGDSVWSFMVL